MKVGDAAYFHLVNILQLCLSPAGTSFLALYIALYLLFTKLFPHEHKCFQVFAEGAAAEEVTAQPGRIKSKTPCLHC